MHRSYRPLNPAQSRILQKKWDQAYYEEHRRRVDAVRPQIDTRPPQTYMHLHLKLKKLQVEEERLAVIERDNRILLQKMSTIMRTNGKDYKPNYRDTKSLNRQRRLRELLRIAKENQEILKRITSSKPQYDHVQWEREWQENLVIMDQISVYPQNWWKQDQEKSGSETPKEKRSSRPRTGEKSNASQREKSNVSQKDESNASENEKSNSSEKSSSRQNEKSAAKKREKSTTERPKKADRESKDEAQSDEGSEKNAKKETS